MRMPKFLEYFIPFDERKLIHKIVMKQAVEAKAVRYADFKGCAQDLELARKAADKLGRELMEASLEALEKAKAIEESDGPNNKYCSKY